MRNIKIKILICLMALFGGAVIGQEQGAVVTLDIRPIQTDSLIAYGDDMTVYTEPGKDGKYVIHFEPNLTKNVAIGINKPFRGSLQLYVENGDNISIKTDFEENTTFSGKGANNARLFHENFMFSKAAWDAIEVKGKTPNYLAKAFNDMFETPLQRLEANKGKVSPTFYKRHHDFLYYQQLGYQLDVPFWYQRETGKKLSESIPDGYWNLLKSVNLDGEVLTTEEFNGAMYTSLPFFLENEYKMKQGTLDSTYMPKDLLMPVYRRIEELTGGALRENMLKVRLEIAIRDNDDFTTTKRLLDEYTQKYSTPGNAANIQDLQNQYNQAVALRSGIVPDNLNLTDEDGRQVNLKELIKGKVVYLDFWASWCAPCRAQMKTAAPKLHKMFESNPDVLFLYVNLDKTIAQGQKAIEEDNIVGTHLFGGDFTPDNPIAKAFSINGIPRYIIIGKDGKVFDVDAPRPSDERAAERLREALAAE